MESRSLSVREFDDLSSDVSLDVSDVGVNVVIQMRSAVYSVPRHVSD